MKRTSILTAFSLFGAILLLGSCGSSRVWETKDRSPRYQQPPPPPAQRYYSSAPLIVTPSPGFRMSQYPDGRFFHRSAQGLMYWKGYDNRFYLDRNYVNRVSYSKWEYKEWKRYSKQNRR